jgi:hypothetical protein
VTSKRSAACTDIAEAVSPAQRNAAQVQLTHP